VEIKVGGKSLGKVRKTSMNPLITELVIEKGLKKMEEIKIASLRHRMKCREKREHAVLTKGLFEFLEAQGIATPELNMDEEDLPVPKFRLILQSEY
jgi:hypothetical protein